MGMRNRLDDGPVPCLRYPVAAHEGALTNTGIRRLRKLWRGFKRLTQLGFPRRFPIVQFPNSPLIVAFAAGQAGHAVHGIDHAYTSATAYLAMTIWAYEEAAHGVNWFRHALGMVYLVILAVRIARAFHA
jgi:hypothetical protein